jgi:hypothetical protein
MSSRRATRGGRASSAAALVCAAWLAATPRIAGAFEVIQDPIYVCNSLALEYEEALVLRDGTMTICHEYHSSSFTALSFPVLLPAVGEQLYFLAQAFDAAGGLRATGFWHYQDAGGIWFQTVVGEWQPVCNQTLTLEVTQRVESPTYAVIWIWSSLTQAWTYRYGLATAHGGGSGNYCPATS